MGKRPFDTNGDGVPDAREFAGSHRYDTAVKLAERFAKDEGAVPTVIIASGETQVDAVTASGLAGNLNAPVLLTRSSMLPHNVARFIADNNVSDVIVVGGAAAVPDSVVTAIESLASLPTVERVFGNDRYETAAAIGNRLGGPTPTWCGSSQPAAVLVNGGDAGRADAIAIGPLAYGLGLPILLTMADEVPDATASFLTDNKVEHVVIVGGTDAVSAGVVNTLIEDIGVINTRRISNGDAAATSVMVAKEMLGNCASVLRTNKDMVALVNREATADGITAAPVMGRGLGDGGPVPILLVGDELPAAVSDYLASTPTARAGHGKTHLSIVAIGGTAVVSDEVMDAAEAAAKTSSELTATIEPLKYKVSDLYIATKRAAMIANGKTVGDYTDQFRVTFSDNVKLAEDGDDANTTVDQGERRGTVEDPTMYRLNGRRLEALLDTPATGNEETVTVRDLVFTADRTVTLTLSHHLEAGDTISVDNASNEAAGLRLGAAGDKRKLEPAELKLGAVTVAKDSAAPAVEIIAAVDSTSTESTPGTFMVYVAEPNLQEVNGAVYIDAQPTVKAVSIPRSGNDRRVDRKVTVQLTSVSTTRKALAGGQGAQFSAALTVTYTEGENYVGSDGVPNTNDDVKKGTTVDASDERIAGKHGLLKGDVITVARNTFRDKDGRGNSLVLYTVGAPTDNGKNGDFEIASVSIGNVQHGHADGQQERAVALLGSGQDAEDKVLRIVALSSGIAAGAQGNDWVVYGYDDRKDGANSSTEFEIEVGVDTDNAVISYTISDKVKGKDIGRVATIEDLATALAAADGFAGNFAVDYIRQSDGTTTQSKNSPLTATDPQGAGFTGGMSSVGVEVRFNDPVRCFTDAGGFDADTNTNAACDDVSSTAVANGGLDQLGDAIAPKYTGTMSYIWAEPDQVIHLSYKSSDMKQLPKRSGFRVIPAGVAFSYGDAVPDDGDDTTTADSGRQDVSSVREILHGLAPNSKIRP